MSGFDERGKGYERKFEREQEHAFKVRARRNRLLGLWAAAELGLKDEAAESYARGIADPSRHLRGDKDIVARIAADFKAQSLAHGATRIRLELEHCAAQAKKELGAAG